MTWANATIHQRAIQPIWSTSRRRCQCGCKQRATHSGEANGVVMMTGCELVVRRWVRDGPIAMVDPDTRRLQARSKEDGGRNGN